MADNNGQEPPITLEELSELGRLELARKGETEADVARKLRARLAALRAWGAQWGSSAQPEQVPVNEIHTPGIEERVAKLEADVKRLLRPIEQ